MKKKTKASAWMFRVLALVLVLATAAAGWMFWKGGYLGGAQPDPQIPALQATEQTRPATEPEANDPVTTEAPAETPAGTASEPETKAPETTEAEEPEDRTVTILAVGDNLIHNMVYSSGYSLDPWNYDHLYQYVKDDIQAADIAVIDQETIFVQDHKNVSNYPCFGTPREIGDAVYKAGFDVILHATNHVMDMGIENIYDAIDFWSDKDVTVLGIHKQADEPPVILEKNGIKIGMLNYVYGLNGFVLPAGNEFAVDLLDYRTKLLNDIAYLEENADITVGFFHMGQEYATRPTQDALEIVELVVSHGVDLLLDCHPHVLQPYEVYTAQNGNEAVVYHSLGNFISAQTRLDSLIGGMAQVTIQKTGRGEDAVTQVVEFGMTPIVTHTAYDTSYAVYKLEDYTDALGARNVLCPMTTAQCWKRYYEIVGKPEEQ